MKFFAALATLALIATAVAAFDGSIAAFKFTFLI